MEEIILLLIFVIALAIFLGHRVLHYDDGCENGVPKYPYTYEIINSFVKKRESRKKNLLRKKIDQVLEGSIRIDKVKLDSLISKLQKQLSSQEVFRQIFSKEKDESEEIHKIYDTFVEFTTGTSKDTFEKDKDRLDKLLKIKEGSY